MHGVRRILCPVACPLRHASRRLLQQAQQLKAIGANQCAQSLVCGLFAGQAVLLYPAPIAMKLIAAQAPLQQGDL
jgi:hypothetical protein